jgi:hypothetical protein
VKIPIQKEAISIPIGSMEGDHKLYNNSGLLHSIYKIFESTALILVLENMSF